MLDKKYCEGYEDEEQIKIWCEEGCEENGLLVWNGFFDTILEGCFKPEFPKGGFYRILRLPLKSLRLAVQNTIGTYVQPDMPPKTWTKIWRHIQL